MTVLVVGSLVTFEAYAEKSMQLNRQESMTTKIESKLTESDKQLQRVNEEKSKTNKSLEEVTEKVKTLEKENADLKAQLQIKIERESRREANLYAYGNCTWYVKEKVPYIGGTWGNANQWFASAQNYGFETGDAPRQGAIGVSFEGYYGHVVFVESVGKDVVEVSEMNAPIFGVVTHRVVPSSALKYIYT